MSGGQPHSARPTTCPPQCVRVSKRDEEEEWEEGPNHVLRVPAAGVRVLDVELDW